VGGERVGARPWRPSSPRAGIVVTLRALARGGHREAYGPGEVEGDEAAEEQKREVLRNIWGGVA
jgi:hypothetical protein